MKKHYWLAVIAATGLFLSCNKDDDQPEQEQDTFYGNPVTIGKGTGRSYVKNTKNHAALEMGLEFSASALEGLEGHELEFVLDIPAEAKSLTPFDHISLGWMPHGHLDPALVYNKPHFDVHFYMISRESELKIDTGAAMRRFPAPALLPANYVPEPGPGVPKMGLHWVDTTSPELKGQPWTSTLIMGTYDAKVIFWEPMITTAFLATKPDITFNIPQPAEVVKPSHYPTKYGIHFDAAKQKYIIRLSAFTHL